MIGLPGIGMAWSPAGSQKLAVRAGYGIFYTFPDTNLMNNTVVTVPFVDNVTVFNDRPPAVPTRTFANFFQGQPIATPNPNPGQPCHSVSLQALAILPGITASLIHLKQQYTQQWNLSLERQIGSRVSARLLMLAIKPAPSAGHPAQRSASGSGSHTIATSLSAMGRDRPAGVGRTWRITTLFKRPLTSATITD